LESDFDVVGESLSCETMSDGCCISGVHDVTL